MREELRRIVDRYPGHELAPHALEAWAASLETDDPAAALAGYEELAERFPDDPFIERVRARLARLRARGAGGEGAAP